MSDDDGTIHAILYKWMTDIVEEMMKRDIKPQATDVGLKLYNCVRKTTNKYRMQMLEILAQDGAHQIAMEFLRQYGPSVEAAPKEAEKAATQKEKEKRDDQSQPKLFQLPPDEYEIVRELEKYGLRGIKTKAGYVLIVRATPGQIREAISLRKAQADTMIIENELLERLAKLRER